MIVILAAFFSWIFHWLDLHLSNARQEMCYFLGRDQVCQSIAFREEGGAGCCPSGSGKVKPENGCESVLKWVGLAEAPWVLS
jgi:hypothetical protein